MAFCYDVVVRFLVLKHRRRLYQFPYFTLLSRQDANIVALAIKLDHIHSNALLTSLVKFSFDAIQTSSELSVLLHCPKEDRRVDNQGNNSNKLNLLFYHLSSFFFRYNQPPFFIFSVRQRRDGGVFVSVHQDPPSRQISARSRNLPSPSMFCLTNNKE